MVLTACVVGESLFSTGGETTNAYESSSEESGCLSAWLIDRMFSPLGSGIVSRVL